MMPGRITHAGAIVFEGGNYRIAGGTGNFEISLYPFFTLDPGPPLGQVGIRFAERVSGAYAVLVSADRLPTSPLLTANHGSKTDEGFVVHLWETAADRTLQNGGFSFLVLQFEE